MSYMHEISLKWKLLHQLTVDPNNLQKQAEKNSHMSTQQSVFPQT